MYVPYFTNKEQRTTNHEPRDMNKKQFSKNLMAWPEITAFCLELRKSFLRAKYGSIDDKVLTIKLFSEIVAKKEKKWTSKKPS